MQWMPKIIVGLVTAMYAALGLGFMFFPSIVLSQPDFALIPNGVAGLSTARGVFGGHFIAMALLCVHGLRSSRYDILKIVALLIAFVAFGRLVGVILDGVHPKAIVGLVVEVLATAGLLFGARRLEGLDQKATW